MKKVLKRFLTLILCLIIATFALPFAEAAQPITIFETYTLPSYLSPIAAPIIAGDINGDSLIDFTDLYRLFDYILEFDIDYVETTIDVNGDEEENIKDAVRLYNYLSGALVEIFPKTSETPTEQVSLLSYNSLTNTQKGIYAALDEGVKNLDGNISVKDFVTLQTYNSDIWAAYTALEIDKPEYFWMPRGYSVGGSVLGDEIIELFVSFEDYYSIDSTQKADLQAQLEESVDTIVSAANEFETDFEKELYVHDYLCEHITYDDYAASAGIDSAGIMPWTSYGAIINGLCVCEGYSRAMQLICQRLGIPCSLVTGNAGGPHMWNIIEIGGELYYLDVTHDDRIDSFGLNTPGLHDHFNTTKERLSSNRSFNETFDSETVYNRNDEFDFFVTEDDNTQYNYYVYTGAYISDENDISSAAQYVIDCYLKGYNTFEINLEDGVSIENAYYNLCYYLYYSSGYNMYPSGGYYSFSRNGYNTYLLLLE